MPHNDKFYVHLLKYLLVLSDFLIIMYNVRYYLPSTYILIRIGEELYKLHASLLIHILLFKVVFTNVQFNLNIICLNQTAAIRSK